jgi:hypothetical protein
MGNSDGGHVIRHRSVAYVDGSRRYFLISSAVAGAVSLGASNLAESSLISAEDLVSVRMIAVLVGLTIFVVAFIPFANLLAEILIRLEGMHAKRE